MRKSEIKWHLCDKEQPKKTGSYLVSSKRNPGRVFQSRYYAPQTWSNGYRLEGGWSLRHPRGERVKIYCWAELRERKKREWHRKARANYVAKNRDKIREKAREYWRSKHPGCKIRGEYKHKEA